MRKWCKKCGCYLDPGEWCDCDTHDQPEQDEARRPVPKKPTTYPREWNSEAYIQRRWREWDLR